jgi:UDP-N-acetylmuramyl pentapeptide phosphotransferase/UDP-N-acetylglucosamine-1-phosphate transferase
VRFLVHSLAALILIFGCGVWIMIYVPVVGHVPVAAWWGIPLAFFWLVGLTNAYNFMDGIDGLAASQAMIAGAGWAVIGTVAGQPTTYFLGLLVAASSLGFLIHNWQPARIFMGDVGSAFLGFTFAFLTLKAGREASRFVLAGVLLVWPFIFDTAFTFLRRLFKGESVFSAHRSHLYQRLVLSGLSHATVALLYIGLDLVGLLSAILVVHRPQAASGLIVVVISLLACGLWTLVILRERKALCH